MTLVSKTHTEIFSNKGARCLRLMIKETKQYLYNEEWQDKQDRVLSTAESG